MGGVRIVPWKCTDRFLWVFISSDWINKEKEENRRLLFIIIIVENQTEDSHPTEWPRSSTWMR